MKKFVIFSLTLGLLCFNQLANAQCAMCRSTVVNNVSNGNELELAAGLNTGILYLFVTPYLLVGLVAFLWYRNAKKAQTNNSKRRIIIR